MREPSNCTRVFDGERKRERYIYIYTRHELEIQGARLVLCYTKVRHESCYQRGARRPSKGIGIFSTFRRPWRASRLSRAVPASIFRVEKSPRRPHRISPKVNLLRIGDKFSKKSFLLSLKSSSMIHNSMIIFKMQIYIWEWKLFSIHVPLEKIVYTYWNNDSF